MAEREEELKSLLMKVKEESEQVDLKLNVQKTKIMASGPITSWQIDGDQLWKQWQTLFLGGSKITADGDCSHEIKRHLLLGRKVIRDTWSNRQVWPWSTKRSRAKANRVLPKNALVTANTLFQQHKRRLYTWTSPDGQH